jgi:hypothetical protein
VLLQITQSQSCSDWFLQELILYTKAVNGGTAPQRAERPLPKDIDRTIEISDVSETNATGAVSGSHHENKAPRAVGDTTGATGSAQVDTVKKPTKWYSKWSSYLREDLKKRVNRVREFVNAPRIR